MNLKKSSLVITVLALAAISAQPLMAKDMTMMTGPQGGSWIPLGGAIKGLFEAAIPGIKITVSPGAGVANVRGLDMGKAQIAFGNSSTSVEGILGQKPSFTKKVTNACQVANMYPQYFQVVASKSANIRSVADFKGKVLVTQPKGNTSEAVASLMLAANGMSYKSFKKTNFLAGYTDAVSMMKDGHADVFMLGTTAPASSVMDLASARDIELVPVDDKTMAALKKINGGFNRLIIKAGTYPKQEKDVPVVAYSTHLMVACDLPEDMVYTMTKTMVTHVDDLALVLKAIKGATAKDMAMDIGVPFHKGALKYYKEIGAL